MKKKTQTQIKIGGRDDDNDFNHILRLRLFVLHHKENKGAELFKYTFCEDSKSKGMTRIPIYDIYVYSRLHFNYKRESSGIFFSKGNTYKVTEVSDLKHQKKKDTLCDILKKKRSIIIKRYQT